MAPIYGQTKSGRSEQKRSNVTAKTAFDTVRQIINTFRFWSKAWRSEKIVAISFLGILISTITGSIFMVATLYNIALITFSITQIISIFIILNTAFCLTAAAVIVYHMVWMQSDKTQFFVRFDTPTRHHLVDIKNEKIFFLYNSVDQMYIDISDVSGEGSVIYFVHYDGYLYVLGGQKDGFLNEFIKATDMVRKSNGFLHARNRVGEEISPNQAPKKAISTVATRKL